MQRDVDPGAILPRRESTRYRLPDDPADILPIVPVSDVSGDVGIEVAAREPSQDAIRAAWLGEEPRVDIRLGYGRPLGEEE